ncbi:MAG: hypothetical protein ABSG76_19340 [Xanthobacteraceae bacterium]|jgi:hypothetical protein
MATTRLNWNRRLSRPLLPAKGPVAQLVTLRDAAWMILEFPAYRQRRPGWLRVSELLHQAATSGGEQDLASATRELEQALRDEGWLS